MKTYPSTHRDLQFNYRPILVQGLASRHVVSASAIKYRVRLRSVVRVFASVAIGTLLGLVFLRRACWWIDVKVVLCVRLMCGGHRVALRTLLIEGLRHDRI